MVVVNDGSNENYNYVFDAISQIENVTYLTYGENHGKGYALKTAFRYCVENFEKNDTIITADCDGQHKIEDIYKVYKACQTHPNDLILGSRNFDLPHVPKKSRAGNLTTRRIFGALYGIRLYDTQTGLRGFTVELAERFLKAKGDRFEYEMNMLIYSKKHGIRILETPIETVYAEDPKDHVSHFRSVRDSARVMGATMSNLSFYLLSSVISAVIDVGVFFVLSTFVFNSGSAVDILISTVGARVISSIFNFIFNFKYVFHGSSKLSIFKYYTLWLVQLGASYGIAFILGNLIGISGIWLSIAKGIGDLLLALVSYQIQQHWVFKGRDPYKFYGFFVSFWRGVWRKFSKKYRCNVLPYDEGVVYVCRHLDMHGPFTTLKWLSFQVHPMVLNIFFDKKATYNQYKNFTFTEKQGKKKKKFSLKSFICSRFVVKLVHSIKAIPVYRGKDVNSITTFKKSLEVLKNKQSIIVYPDIDYSDDKEKVSEIYDGFLYLGELYKKRTKKSLKFVPIYINDEDFTINECDYITVDSFKEQRKEAAEYIKNAINTKA
ncbi:MAG: glycosyltransferase [Clostridia bacterium]|nr:glycosyltransferase [Clostridia bacterium]